MQENLDANIQVIPRPFMESAFAPWMYQTETLWACDAIEMLRKANLLDFGESQCPITYLRLLALAKIYSEFCDVAWELTFNLETMMYCAEELGVDDAMLTKLESGNLLTSLGVEEESNDSQEEEDWDDEEDEFTERLNPLVERERPCVVAALLEGFGDAKSLYAALWMSRDDGDYALYRNPEQDAEDEPADDPWWPVTDDRSNALGWVQQGCSR